MKTFLTLLSCAAMSLFLANLAKKSTASVPFPDVPATGGNYQVIHSFSGPDGGAPNSIIQVADGSFFGTTANGGPPVIGLPDGRGQSSRSIPPAFLAPPMRLLQPMAICRTV